jgi:hypothetical protein
MLLGNLVRAVAVVGGCAAVVWGLTTFPIFWRSLPIEHVAGRIIGRVAYKPETLAEQLPAIDKLEAESDCEPRALQSSAIVLLRIMEDGFVPDQLAQLDRRINAVQAALRRSLACSPADPFLWIVLYSVESARNGLRPEYLDYIRASYRLGPHEGWIALKRNQVVLAIFPILPADLAETAIGEFAELVGNHLYDESADILLGPGWNIRDQLLARLSNVGERERTEFAARLYERGFDLRAPGVAPPAARPWR